MKEILDKYVKNSEKEILREKEVDIFIREFKEKLNFLGELKILEQGDKYSLKSRNWLLGDELLAFYEFHIKDNIMEITYLETLNSNLDFDYDNRMTTNSLAKIPGFGKYLILDIITQTKKIGLNKIKFNHILKESQDFYKKMLKFVSENKLIESFIYEKYTDNIGEIRKNIIIRL